jgi:hypothetical protein
LATAGFTVELPHPAFDPGRLLEAYRGGSKIWEGILGEPVPGDDADPHVGLHVPETDGDCLPQGGSSGREDRLVTHARSVAITGTVQEVVCTVF